MLLDNLLEERSGTTLLLSKLERYIEEQRLMAISSALSYACLLLEKNEDIREKDFSRMCLEVLSRLDNFSEEELKKVLAI